MTQREARQASPFLMEFDMKVHLSTESYVDVSRVAAEFGFRQAVMITRPLHIRLLPDEAETAAGESYLYRLSEVLSQALDAVQTVRTGQSSWSFQAFLWEGEASGQWSLNRVELRCCRQGKGYIIGFPDDLAI